jgi:hypothetical protein
MTLGRHPVWSSPSPTDSLHYVYGPIKVRIESATTTRGEAFVPVYR